MRVNCKEEQRLLYVIPHDGNSTTTHIISSYNTGDPECFVSTYSAAYGPTADGTTPLQRLQWAMEHYHWTIEKWKKVNAMTFSGK
ncbi:hypothetical protein TNCV_1002441 [Trichonephila clavipes]|nr:hypothetical protein TNCV_1002441 [Trichonephila clavipes]